MTVGLMIALLEDMTPWNLVAVYKFQRRLLMTSDDCCEMSLNSAQATHQIA
jgi:hypothetical protein